MVRAGNWRVVHGPGLDDPLIAFTANPSLKELYHVTDGGGRHFATGEAVGSLNPDIPTTEGLTGWNATGSIGNSASFGAERMSKPGMPGLSFFRNRVYDQATGRWTQEDPIGIAGGLNLYQFNGNNPVNFTDPFGLDPCDPPDSLKCKDRIEPTMLDPTALLAPAKLAGGLAVGLAKAGGRAILSFASKSAAREGVESLGLPAAQRAAVRSAIGRATTREEIEIIAEDGGKVMVHLIRPGRDGFQIMQSVVQPDATKVVTQYGVSANGRVIIDLK